jgi:TatD family-associated radical SAM protein
MHVYEHREGLYLNITNRCPVACAFCVKKDWGWQFHGQDLLLDGVEPTVRSLIDEINERLGRPGLYREMVFCGFGEPTMRMDAMNAVGLHVRLHRPETPIRLNTVGLGSLVHGRDIVPELALFLDSVSVSLNTADPVQWEEIHRPAPIYRGRGFVAARAFAERCAKAGLRTRVTAVERPDVDLAPLAAYALRIGAEFMARAALN